MTFLRTARVTALSILPVALALPAIADVGVRPTPRPDAPIFAEMPDAPTVPEGWRDRLVAANLASIHADLPVAPTILPYDVRQMGNDMPVAPGLPSLTDVAVFIPIPVVLHGDMPVADVVGPVDQAVIEPTETAADAG
ncbi:hypothetical protein [Jannaschia pohangensis]|uniref:Uncharacterized protein n=1 Tax=Jannaschia pohangensis TaxID=390807 RepID=A0A1I3H1I6_9RHOB|nr:hypothetical protein [Jannaschia pohangensis]SFI29549.1 hypothetical protein SAMN04488095_0418 [Jannaschia pohangensis]